MRPTFFRSPCPAMPVTSVPSISGATITLISRRKMSLNTRRCAANPGQSSPISSPTNIAQENPECQRTPLNSCIRKRRQSHPAQRCKRNLPVATLPAARTRLRRAAIQQSVLPGKTFEDSFANVPTSDFSFWSECRHHSLPRVAAHNCLSSLREHRLAAVVTKPVAHPFRGEGVPSAGNHVEIRWNPTSL